MTTEAKSEMRAGSGVYLCVDRDGLTKGIQLSIDGLETGFRLAGPKYNGSSLPLLRRELTEEDCRELEKYIAEARRNLAVSPTP